ncbi:unnamed protein product [Merluccius merluccius]
MDAGQSAKLPPYILPMEGEQGSESIVYHLHSPFTPPGEEDFSKPAASGTQPPHRASPDPGKQRFVSPDSDLGHTPGMTTCTSCQQQVMTNVTYKAGTYAWLMCLLFICCGLVLCCCLIPFFLKNFKDAYHTCPRCNRVLYVDKKKCCS